MLQVGVPPSPTLLLPPGPGRKPRDRTEWIGAARTCFPAAGVTPSPSPQAVLLQIKQNALLKMKQNVSIPSWVISSRKAEEQRGRSLIKRFGVSLAAFSRGLCLSEGREAGIGVPGVWEGPSSAQPSPSLSPPGHLQSLWGVQGMLVKMPPWGHLCCDVGGCLSGGSFAVKSPN